jgi:hypothetical protein
MGLDWNGRDGNGRGNILKQQMQTIPQRKHNIIKHNLILLHAAHDIHHDIALALIQHDPVIVEYDIGCLLCGFLEEPFLECFLGFDVRVGGGWCTWICYILC